MVGRLGLVGLLVFCIKVFEKTLPHLHGGECIRDEQHIITQSFNNVLRENPTLVQFCQGMYTFVFDITFILYSVYWYKKGRSARYIIALWLYYTFKIIFDASIWMTAPDFMIWEPSVIPSLFIKSDKTYNFTCAFIPGIYIIIMRECMKLSAIRKFWPLVLTFCVTTVFYAIFAQINWTSDLCSSIFLGLFASEVGDF
jgi:hypothetical protein